MNQRQFSGARWWKFDFHTHTPASKDFMQGCPQENRDQVTCEFWLQKFMEQGIDCVAITDHNSGAWIDELKEALDNLSQSRPESRPDWYRPLYLFPGAEISAQGDIHILAIFGDEKNKEDIDKLMGAIGYKGTPGDSNGVTTKPITEVVDAINERGGIAIPAHSDKEKGLFELKSQTLEQVLANKNIYAMELCDDNCHKPTLYKEKQLAWAEVRGSDTHNFRGGRFGDYTWVKMDKPSIEGLKLALIDGAASVDSNMEATPNRHADCVIEEICVDKARYMGRSGSDPLTCQFSPFLNTIIGGRGSGKSTLLEFMRLILRQDDEIPDSLREESGKYFRPGENSLLLDDSRLSLIYRKGKKGEIRYRLNWPAKADTASLQIKTADGWKDEHGDIRALFPAYIYSQKQIFTLAQKPDAMLNIIDQEPSVEYETFQREYNKWVNDYKSLKQQAEQLKEQVGRKDRLTGALNDTTRQIEQIEKSGHKDVLQSYRRRRRQLSVIDHLEEQWKKTAVCIQETQQEIAPASLEQEVFDGNQDILQAITEVNNKWDAINERMDSLRKEAQHILMDWEKEKGSAGWMNSLNVEIEQYNQLRTRLEQEQIDPDKYPLLLQKKEQYQKELGQIAVHRKALDEAGNKERQALENILDARRQLTERRTSFLADVLQGNPSVDIELKPFGQHWDEVEEHVRRLLQCEGRFDRDFEELKRNYRSGGLDAARKLKERVTNIRNNDVTAKDHRFANHLQNLPQESISDLMCWFPQDTLEITSKSNGRKQNIRQGSPGQKTAALLAFILSYGTAPLLLDQPEDDLDNELIYELIVKELRNTKSKRQLIVITHNANIVVNGDAEMVLPLTVKKGQSLVTSPASIQENRIRERICDILEGGQEAFSQRYKRLHLDGSDA